MPPIQDPGGSEPPASSCRVVGVDPGLARMGLAALERSPEGRTRARTATVVRTGADTAHPQRLRQLSSAVSEALHTHRPVALACEAVYFSVNTASAMSTNQAAAVAQLAAAEAGVAVATYAPSRVKAAVTGTGDAAKERVGDFVAAHLGLDGGARPSVDAVDALAVALTHLWSAEDRWTAAGAASWDAAAEGRAVTMAGGRAATDSQGSLASASPRLREAAERAEAGATVVRRGRR